MTTRRVVLVTALLLVAGSFWQAQAAQPSAHAPSPTAALPEREAWRGWDTYHVIMWSTGDSQDRALWFQRLKEMGCTAEQCTRGNDPTPFVESRFGFYVENLVPELAFLHARSRLYTEDFDGYVKTRDQRFLVRKPCFNDPEFWKQLEPRLQNLVRLYAGHRPLLYDLRDELSIGRFASPMDYCFCPHTLREFRKWLQVQYESLDALNQEWETDFASWDQVVPMTTYEIKERERQALAEGRLENYAPWADHRAFMDDSFARALDRMRGFIRDVDTTTPVGIEGTQMPSAWGGYDLWRLSQVIDWAEPYDIANSREIFRSFLPSTAPVVGTVFGSDIPRIRRQLWWLVLHGDRGCIIWDDEKSRCIEKTQEDMPITTRGRGLAEVFAELKSVAPKLFALERLDDGIAIHYSQASIRAHWMFDSRPDGDTWVRRFSSHEATHSRAARVRDSFVRIVEDLGLQYKFISYEQIENGQLLEGGYKALLLPQSVAMSKKECEQVAAFVRSGGTVIADTMTATMDEHCKRLPQGQLDSLFGVRASDQPNGALKVNRVGEGRAVYLARDLHDYGKLRLTPPGGESYRKLFRQLLKDAGIEALVNVRDANGEPAACVEVWRYRGKDADAVAVMRNPEFDAHSLTAIGYPSNAAIEKSERVHIILPHKMQVTDLRSGQSLGVTDRVTVELDAWSPSIHRLTATQRSWPRN